MYSATFLDENDNLLKDFPVFLTFAKSDYAKDIDYSENDSYYDKTFGSNITYTNSRGIVSISFPNFSGNLSLTIANMKTFGIKRYAIEVFDVITGVKDCHVFFNSNKNYTLRIFGDDGKPVGENQKVVFTVNNKKYNVLTDENGYARLKLDFKPGNYMVTAKYMDYVVSSKVVVKPTLIPLTKFNPKKLSKKFKFKIKLLSNAGNILKYKKVTVKFNKKTYIAKTNKKGIVTFSLKTPKKAGKYNIVSSFGKSKVTTILIKYKVKCRVYPSF